MSCEIVGCLLCRVCIERGKRISMGEKIVINEVEISELGGGLHRYQGVDEDIGYD